MGEVAEAFLIGGACAGAIILAGWAFGHFASAAFSGSSYRMTDDEEQALVLATTVCLLASVH